MELLTNLLAVLFEYNNYFQGGLACLGAGIAVVAGF